MATLRIRAPWSVLLAALCLSMLGSCAPHAIVRTVQGNRFVVSAEKSPFYKYGPAQAYGADTSLAKGQKVTMLVRQFGFSQIRLDNGMTGYVATDDLTQLPPEKATPTPKPIASRRPSAPLAPERGLDLNDTPAPALPQ